MPRLNVAAKLIGKTSFFKDVSHFNTMPLIALKESVSLSIIFEYCTEFHSHGSTAN
jgi:hypothetical protein